MTTFSETYKAYKKWNNALALAQDNPKSFDRFIAAQQALARVELELEDREDHSLDEYLNKLGAYFAEYS